MSDSPENDSHPSGESAAEAWFNYERYPYLLAKLALFAVVILGLYLLFHSVQSVLFPVLASLLLAYLLDPLVDRLEERGWSRTRAILLLLLTGFGALALFLVFLVPVLVHQVSDVIKGAPQLVTRVETELIPWLETNTGLTLPESASAALATYGETLQAQLPAVAKASSRMLTGALSSIGAIAGSAIILVMIPVFTFYFLRDFDDITRTLGTFLPKANRDFVVSRIQRVDDVIGAWFRGQVEVALILAGMYAIGLAIVFGWAGVGVGAGLALGVLAGLLNVVPYLGFLVGFVLAVAMVLLQGAGLGPLIGVLAVFAIVQALEGWVITPRIVGDKVGLSPVVVIIALLLGQELLGLAGVLLALPIAGAIRVLLPDLIAFYRHSSLYTGVTTAAKDRRGFVEIAMEAERQRDGTTSPPA